MKKETRNENLVSGIILAFIGGALMASGDFAGFVIGVILGWGGIWLAIIAGLSQEPLGKI